jgi:hypothetical protein
MRLNSLYLTIFVYHARCAKHLFDLFGPNFFAQEFRPERKTAERGQALGGVSRSAAICRTILMSAAHCTTSARLTDCGTYHFCAGL